MINFIEVFLQKRACARTRRRRRTDLQSSLTLLIQVTLLLAALLGTSTPSWADADTARAQRQLLERGFNPGPVDGLMGPRTRSAIRNFQRDRGLSESGRLERQTRDALFAPAPGEPAPAETEALKAPEPPPAEPIPPATEAATPPETPPQPAAASRPAGGAKLLGYQTLEWPLPQGGPDALDRFRRNAGSPEMARSTEELIVPRGDNIYVVLAGERIPGFDCDPSKGRVEMELMLGLGGPVVFRALDKQGYCKLGFGILLEVGQRIRMVGAAWGDDAIPAGVVEVAPEGLRYVSME